MSYLETFRELEEPTNKSKQDKEDPSEPSQESTAEDSPLVEKAQYLLENEGLCELHSRLLGETIVVIRDENTPMPEQHSARVSYTLKELRSLVATDPPADHMKHLHQVKKFFPESQVEDIDET